MSMTEAEVQARLDAIRAVKEDDEAAHLEEDRLREDVLQAIANGTKNPRRLAFLALKTREMDFCRWYA